MIINNLLIVFFIVLLICRILKHKDITSPVIVFSVMAPGISLFGRNIDGGYIILLVIIFITLFKSKLYITHSIKVYILISVMLAVIYAFAWILNSRVSISSLIISILGMMRVPLLVLFLYSLDKEKIENDFLGIFKHAINIIILLNFIAVVLQMILPIPMFNLCYSLYYSKSSVDYVSMDYMITGSAFYKGIYYRYFGLCDTPTELGTIMSMSCAFWYCIQNEKTRHYVSKISFINKWIQLAMILFIGFQTRTKTFMLTLPILIVIHILVKFRQSKKKVIVYVLGMLMFFIGIVLCFDTIYVWLRSWNPGIAYVFQYLGDPLTSLVTRFGSDTSEGFLEQTLKVIIQNPIIGVGPASAKGEFIGDNAFIVLLHNGGIFALVLILGYYLRWLMHFIKKNELFEIIPIITILITGMGSSTLIGSAASILLMIRIIYLDTFKVDINFSKEGAKDNEDYSILSSTVS